MNSDSICYRSNGNNTIDTIWSKAWTAIFQLAKVWQFSLSNNALSLYLTPIQQHRILIDFDPE